MNWEMQGCSEEGKTRAGWHFWSTLKSSGMGLWNSSPWSVPMITGLRDPGGFWSFQSGHGHQLKEGEFPFIGIPSHIKGGQHPLADTSDTYGHLSPQM